MSDKRIEIKNLKRYVFFKSKKFSYYFNKSMCRTYQEARLLKSKTPQRLKRICQTAK